ncbi:MAG: DUF2461 domain-containing protein [Actinomycetota bacterium]|nr:DUF2461 domain-containing protein [Actinomycetota bacterium]
MAEFTGFPEAALDFYDDLEMDNTKSFWEAHKSTYAEAVAAPMKALTDSLEDEFGTAKIFRPYRDVRFAKDKTPYKTAQGAFVPSGPATGRYVQVGAAGVRIGVGFYDASSARLASIREAIDDKAHGVQLEDILGDLQGSGWTLGGDTLKTSPRGYDADHPRIVLLRHKSMNLSKDYGFEKFIHTPGLADRIRADWREASPFVDWILAHARG